MTLRDLWDQCRARIAADSRCRQLLPAMRALTQAAAGTFVHAEALIERIGRRRLIAWGVMASMAGGFIGLTIWRWPPDERAIAAARRASLPAKQPTPAPIPTAPKAPEPRFAHQARVNAPATPAPQPAAPSKPQPSAVSQIERVKASYLTARQRCLARLAEDPEYLSARAECDRLEAEVRMLRIQDPQNRLQRASLDWIQAKGVVSTLTAIALGTDPDVQQAEMVLRGLGLMRASYSLPASPAQAETSAADSSLPQASAADGASLPLPAP